MRLLNMRSAVVFLYLLGSSRDSFLFVFHFPNFPISIMTAYLVFYSARIGTPGVWFALVLFWPGLAFPTLCTDRNYNRIICNAFSLLALLKKYSILTSFLFSLKSPHRFHFIRVCYIMLSKENKNRLMGYILMKKDLNL